MQTASINRYQQVLGATQRFAPQAPISPVFWTVFGKLYQVRVWFVGRQFQHGVGAEVIQIATGEAVHQYFKDSTVTSAGVQYVARMTMIAALISTCVSRYAQILLERQNIQLFLASPYNLSSLTKNASYPNLVALQAHRLSQLLLRSLALSWHVACLVTEVSVAVNAFSIDPAVSALQTRLLPTYAYQIFTSIKEGKAHADVQILQQAEILDHLMGSGMTQKFLQNMNKAAMVANVAHTAAVQGVNALSTVTWIAWTGLRAIYAGDTISHFLTFNPSKFCQSRYPSSSSDLLSF